MVDPPITHLVIAQPPGLPACHLGREGLGAERDPESFGRRCFNPGARPPLPVPPAAARSPPGPHFLSQTLPGTPAVSAPALPPEGLPVSPEGHAATMAFLPTTSATKAITRVTTAAAMNHMTQQPTPGRTREELK